MVSVIEDSDEEYLDDPIRLIDFEQKRIKATSTLVQESIEISDSDVDSVSLPTTPKSSELAKPAKPSCKTVSSTLPVTFFKISRNIELLYKCLPLRIKIVDCDKHPWYYRRKYKNIKFENVVFDVINENEETMKLKIRPVDIKSYLKSPIRDIKTAMCRQNNDKLNKLALKGPDEKNILPIDLKKNKGLVGLKIVYDENIKGCNSKIENNKQLKEDKISKNDSQNKKDKDVEIKGSPKNHHKKRDVKPCPGFVCTSDSHKVNCEEKNNLENSESLKLQSTLKFTEEKMCKVKEPSQAQVEFASKKDKKCCDQKIKPKAAKEQKIVKERKVAQTHKIEQNNKSSKIKETNVVTQKNEMKVVHNEIKNNDKMVQKLSRTKPAISKTSEKESISRNESSQKVNLGYDELSMKISSNIAKDSEKRTHEKRKVPKILQQNVDKHFEQRQDNPQKSEKGVNKDQLPVSMARVSMGINSQNMQKKSLIPSNKGVRNDIKFHNHLPVPSIMTPNNEKSFVLTDINDREIDVFASQIPGKWKTIGQRNPKEVLSSFDQPINNKNYMKTFVDSKSVSKVVNNEGYTDNKIPNNSQTLLTSKVANGHSNVKSVLNVPASSKNEHKNELQPKQELSKQQLNIGGSEYATNKHVPAPNKKVVIYPVSHYNALAENIRPTSDIATQEKRSISYGKLATSHNSLSTRIPTIPTSANQMLPNLDPRLVRYQLVSQNVSHPKELPKSVSQSLLHKKMVSTPPPYTKIAPNILNHARIIIKRPTSEANSIPGQQLVEKQYCSNGSPNKTLKLIPTLTSTQKGRYVIINKNFTNKKIVVHQEHLQQHNMPKLDNTPLLNQTSNEYLLPGVSPHKNQVTSKERSTNKRPSLNQAQLPNQQPNSYRQNELRKENSTQYTNLQPSQPNISGHNYGHNAIQPPLSNSLPHPNPQPPYYVHNEHTQYYNDNSLQNTNQLPLSNQDLKQNEYGCYYNNSTMVNTEQPPLQTQPNPNEYESYYNHSTLAYPYQEPSYHQQNPNGNGSGTNQNTILNLDTNTLMQPPPLYFPQNNDMDCAYWNGVNYLGDEWQQGYPQHTQPPPSAFPQYMTPPPEYQHPLSLPYPQNLHPPPNMQHPLPPSDLPQQSTIPQYPQPSKPVSQNPPPPAAIQYPQPASFTQHPPPPVPQHPVPALPNPSSYLPTVTQGSTILGSNNNGVVRTINLVTSINTAPKLTTSKNSSSDDNNIPVNTKSEMLQELSKSMDIGNPNLKRSISDSCKELSKFPNGNLPPGPLAKVRKIEGLAADPPSVQKALNNGYSPPILPIPTYEKTFEYIAQVSGYMEKTSNNRVDDIVDKCNGKKIESILKKKSDIDGCADGDKGDKPVKKISIDEYKNRAYDNKTEGKDVVKIEIKSESKFDDTDLGYDSDSTVIL